MDLAAINGILHGRAGFFEHTPPPMPSRWGVSLKQEKPPRLRWLFESIVTDTRDYR